MDMGLESLESGFLALIGIILHQKHNTLYWNTLIINTTSARAPSLVHMLGRVTRDVPASLHSASLLHAACHYGNTRLAEVIIEKAPFLLLTATAEGYLPVHMSVAHQQIESLSLLIHHFIHIHRQKSASNAVLTMGSLHSIQLTPFMAQLGQTIIIGFYSHFHLFRPQLQCVIRH